MLIGKLDYLLQRRSAMTEKKDLASTEIWVESNQMEVN
jgi:hypothetical protein